MENKNLNEVKDLNENEVEKVAGGADKSINEILKERIEEIISKSPPPYEQEYICSRCLRHFKRKVQPPFYPQGRMLCSDCIAGRSLVDILKEKSKQKDDKK